MQGTQGTNDDCCPVTSNPKTVELVVENDDYNEHACANPRQCTPSEQCRCVLLLSTDTPRRVISINSKFENVFGFKINGMQRSLRVITGPKTDTRSLNDVLDSTSEHQSCTCSLIFYEKSGDEVLCTVRSKYERYEGLFVISLDFETSASIQKSHDEQNLGERHCKEKFELTDNLISEPCFSSEPSIDSSVFIHMQAVKRAALAAKRNNSRLSSLDAPSPTPGHSAARCANFRQ
jgi:hypothetical protein